VDLETFRVYVPEGKFKTAKMYVDKEVILGIRPEDINDYDFLPDANPENVVVVTVDVTELIGAEIYLHVSNGPHSFTAAVDAHTKATDAEEHRLVINNQKIHLFDKDTEKVIP
jgi:multiple sugar transport system ATP-binding protein